MVIRLGKTNLIVECSGLKTRVVAMLAQKSRLLHFANVKGLPFGHADPGASLFNVSIAGSVLACEGVGVELAVTTLELMVVSHADCQQVFRISVNS